MKSICERTYVVMVICTITVLYLESILKWVHHLYSEACNFHSHTICDEKRNGTIVRASDLATKNSTRDSCLSKLLHDNLALVRLRRDQEEVHRLHRLICSLRAQPRTSAFAEKLRSRQSQFHTCEVYADANS
jgi:hypothetical protein